jgi:hypothetical protein
VLSLASKATLFCALPVADIAVKAKMMRSFDTIAKPGVFAFFFITKE